MTEFAFATIRHRSSGEGLRHTPDDAVDDLQAWAMGAERSWRRLCGFRRLAKVIDGVSFTDGVEVAEDSRAAA